MPESQVVLLLFLLRGRRSAVPPEKPRQGISDKATELLEPMSDNVREEEEKDCALKNASSAQRKVRPSLVVQCRNFFTFGR